MASFLVLSYRHGLAPLAWRLKREGHSVEMIPWADRYERAWAGKLDSLIQGNEKRNPENIRQMRETIDSEGITVISDSRSWQERVGSSHIHYGLGRWDADMKESLRVGAWFDGEAFQHAHLIVVDRGLFPSARSGQNQMANGPDVDAAMTVVRPWSVGSFDSVLDPVAEELKSASFRGLAQVGLRLDNQGVHAESVRAGWSFLHTHALLASMGDSEWPLGETLTERGAPMFQKRFTVVIPVTVPPWPIECNAPSHEVPIEGLAPGQERHFFWHDVKVDEENRRLLVAGLDGLVGVARGVGSNLLLARHKALALASALRIPEKQFRTDAAGQVEQVLALFEQMGAEL